MLDGLAHSYKTPLTAIQAASSGLLALRNMTQTQTELVSIIDDQAMLLGRLTTRLLQTAALEAKDVRLRRSITNLAVLLREVVEAQDDSIQERTKVNLPEKLLPVAVDNDLMKLAVTQLLDNAAKYSDVGRSIEISAVQTPLETVLAVTNEGPTIPPPEWERIFLRFERGADAARGPTGTGLGLSIVKKTAEAHGGRTWVTSQAGVTCFSLAVPNHQGDKDD